MWIDIKVLHYKVDDMGVLYTKENLLGMIWALNPHRVHGLIPMSSRELVDIRLFNKSTWFSLDQVEYNDRLTIQLEVYAAQNMSMR